MRQTLKARFDTFLFPYKKEKEPIFLLGNQKSGTSIIAFLLGEATGCSYQIDISGFYEPVQGNIHSGELLLEKAISKFAAAAFAKKIIKEPALTFLFPKLYSLYPNSKFVFIVRHPVDNIRSILNRCKLPGNLNQLPTQKKANLSREWEKIIFNDWLGCEYSNYIESLACRWNEAAKIYLSNRDFFTLIQYETFKQDKAQTINKLAFELELPTPNDIGVLVDTQLQPKGSQTVTWHDFFGEENLKRIEDICGENMRKLGYKVIGQKLNTNN